MARHSTLFLAALALTLPVAALAQQPEHDHANGDVAQQAPATDATQPMTDGAMDHAAMPAPTKPDTTKTDNTKSALRDPHAYAEGEDFGPLGSIKLADKKSFGAVIVDRLESVNSSDNSALNYDVQAWYGRTFDRATLKAEGEVDAGKLQDSRTELLWSHAIATYWDTQAGVRHDTGVDPDRTWLAVGVQGLAPYWFDIEATAYLGDQGRSALRFAATYDMLFTQKLILQPRLETSLYGKSDPARQIGSGLSGATAGLRLRYEFTRQFAPYIGVEWAGKLGQTADLARAAGTSTDDTRWVAGVRMWF